MRLAVIDDAPLAEAILQQWKARAEAELKIVNLTLEQTAKRKTLSTDAVIYPSAMLGELVGKNWLAPLDADLLDNHTLARSEVFDLLRLRETNWGDGVYGIPLGGPVLSLAYRTDLVPQPPENWHDYEQTASQIASAAAKSKSATPETDKQANQDFRRVLEPLAEQWAGEVFLARAAAYARRRDSMSTLFDIETMSPLLNAPSFERALRELVAVAKRTPECLQMTPQDTAQAILDGRCGMAITWLNRETESPARPQPVAFAELPGSPDVYERRKDTWGKRAAGDDGRVTLLGVAGRMGSVTRLSSQPQEAANRLSLISSADWSRRISPKSAATAPFRSKHLAYVEAWCDKLDSSLSSSYGAALESSLRRRDWLFSPRIPGRQDYMNSLSEAVRSAASGQQSAAEALENACKAWQDITNERSVPDQLRAYKASLVR